MNSTKMNSPKIKSLNTNGPLSENLLSFGNFIRKLRTHKEITVELLAAQTFLRPETIRRLEAGRCLPICDEDLRRLESALGCKRNALILKANEHRSYIVQFIETFHNQIVAMVDALRIYHADEIDKILNETVHKWTTNSVRKESEQSMATSRRMTTAKPAVAPKRTAKSAPAKVATKRATTPAKTAAPKRASSSRSTKR